MERVEARLLNLAELIQNERKYRSEESLFLQPVWNEERVESDVLSWSE